MTDTATDLENLLQQLAEKLGSTPSGQHESSPGTPTASETPSSTTGPSPVDVLKFREMFAEEMKYWEMIPPLDSETRREIDLIMQQLPELLKSLPNQPFLSSQTDRMVAAAVSRSAGLDERFLPTPVAVVDHLYGQEVVRRIVEWIMENAATRAERGEALPASDQELIAVIERMQKDIFGDERAVPVVLVVAVVGITGAAAGVSIGSAAKKAWNRIWD